MFRSMLCALALIIATPAGADPAKIKIAPGIWDWYQDYLQKVGSTRRGAFAVSVDGYAAGRKYCPGNRCQPGTVYNAGAIESCKQNAAPGVECVIFAKDREIVIEYEIGE